MMRVAVVDDEPLARRGVITRLQAHADTMLCGEYADGTAALNGLRDKVVDVVFLDVQMPDMNGLDVLAMLAPERRPKAILLTAHDCFAVRAFELDAVDYLLKPVDDVRFDEALQRTRTALRMPSASAEDVDGIVAIRRLSTKIGRRTCFIDTDDVEWIAADGDYALLHVGARSYPVRESLNRLSHLLDPQRFVRVHRSAIVRVDCIREMQPLTNRDAILLLREGTPVRVSRTYIDDLLARLHHNRG
ncbi:LytTR family DNA-binding domain-containing protein [Oleiagrimonas sp. C23AA]|uniref:LytR/AlgR family response regulator transcription factor n=1 Tax=Oleiagrimonas sp. C23AA TaxID=2719047 RepID=UPI00141FC84C|nr:LytTR family DNA-binding domain-containing protein [Oleiagrimonas sp. C23AA]NII11062.1 response regulator transcription factor [Oleiagrimonas sp. C23AA]